MSPGDIAKAKQTVILEGGGLGVPFELETSALHTLEMYFRSSLGLSGDKQNRFVDSIYCSRHVFTKVSILNCFTPYGNNNDLC